MIFVGFLMTLIFHFELYLPTLFLNIYSGILKRFGKKQNQINIDGYFLVFIYRCFWFLFCLITSLMVWGCYSLSAYNRVDVLAGWLSFFSLAAIFPFIFISYYLFIFHRKKNLIVSESTVPTDRISIFREVIPEKTKRCFTVGIFLKLASFLLFVSFAGMMILFTIQSVWFIQDYEPVPGTMVSITVTSNSGKDPQTMKIHLYCEGDPESQQVVLLDADVGVVSPYVYMKPLIGKLGNYGYRACVIERAGYGFSDAGPMPRDLGERTMSEMILVIKKASVRTPFILVSHAQASYVARLMLEKHPKLLRGLVLLHPSHENHTDYFLKNLRGLSDEQVQSHQDALDKRNNDIRYTGPISLPRFFPLFFFTPSNDFQYPYEHYHMNGWKSYINNIIESNQTVTSTTQQKSLIKTFGHTFFTSKYSNTIWSELKNVETISSKLRQSRNSTIFHSNSTIPITILTSRHLLNGSCNDNFFDPTSALCSNFIQNSKVHGEVILTLHQDLAHYYNVTSWKIVESSYDIALHRPQIVCDHVSQMFSKTNT